MSALLRLHLSRHAYDLVDPLLWHLFRPEPVYVNPNGDRTHPANLRRYILRVELPRQVNDFFTLMGALREVSQSTTAYSLGKRDAYALAERINRIFGFHHFLVKEELLAEEKVFVQSITHDPRELANWAAYADWLQEQENPKYQKRGRQMAAWLAPEPRKIRYAVQQGERR